MTEPEKIDADLTGMVHEISDTLIRMASIYGVPPVITFAITIGVCVAGLRQIMGDDAATRVLSDATSGIAQAQCGGGKQ